MSRLPKHGWHGTSEYKAWVAMRTRCNDRNYEHYAHYGGRGIKVCESWQSFENFIEDMGPKPSSKHSLDRKDNDGDYEPNNCRWATWREQALNTSRNRLITFRGVTMTMKEWSEKTGISTATIHSRIARDGFSPERALTKPSRKQAKAA